MSKTATLVTSSRFLPLHGRKSESEEEAVQAVSTPIISGYPIVLWMLTSGGDPRALPSKGARARNQRAAHLAFVQCRL